jgi:hypothetical protein
MEAIAKDEALRRFASTRRSGEHVDERLFGAIRGSQALYKISLSDAESFHSLIWQERAETRLLTPRGQPRTMRDISCRLRHFGGLTNLASTLDVPQNQHNPEWFRTCVLIDKAFDFSRFGWISIAQPTDGERHQSPAGSFYIYDGVHRTLVLAKRLLTGETDFKPISALLIVPRPI